MDMRETEKKKFEAMLATERERQETTSTRFVEEIPKLEDYVESTGSSWNKVFTKIFLIYHSRSPKSYQKADGQAVRISD